MAAMLFIAFVGTVWLANWLVATFGPVPVGFGLMAPAGVYAVGLAFTLRDLLQERAGRHIVPLAILVGAGLSVALGGRLALASGCAFLFSELADWAVYTPLRERRWLTAVALSNLVGLTVDSALFLGLAFGSWVYLPGQIVGKLWMTGLALVVCGLLRRPAPSC